MIAQELSKTTLSDDSFQAIFIASLSARRAMSHLSRLENIRATLGLLMMEICKFPPGERQRELGELIESMPAAFELVETGVREALAIKARR